MPERDLPLLPGIRLLRMLWRMLPPVFIGVNLIAWAHLLDASESLKRQALVTSLFIIAFTGVAALVREILSPHRPGMRLVAMADHRAERLAAVVRALAFIFLFTELAIYLVHANEWHEAVASALALFRNTAIIIFVASALSRSAVFRSLRPDSIESYGDVLRSLIVRVVYPIAVLTALFFVFASALDQFDVAQWFATRVGWTVVILIVVRVLYRYLRLHMRRAVAFIHAEETEAAGGEATEPSPTHIGVERMAGRALKIAVIIGTFLLLLRTWGLTLDGLIGILEAHQLPVFGASYFRIANAAVQVATVLILWSFVKDLLIFIVFPKADTAVGIRYAILTILRYTVFVLAAFVGLDALEIDTSALAVFAGAFGVGLAFGLRDIFANFFSGLIILLERPVRVGDLVQVGSVTGRIEAIRLRGTSIRTGEGTTIIIPNQQMIGERLTNMSHDMKRARLQVQVGVAYDADPALVERVLVNAARDDGRILSDPGPFVRFTNFGDSSIDFTLNAYTAHVDDRWAIGSDLRRAVFASLKRADIEIPFPQVDHRITYDVRFEEEKRARES